MTQTRLGPGQRSRRPYPRTVRCRPKESHNLHFCPHVRSWVQWNATAARIYRRRKPLLYTGIVARDQPFDAHGAGPHWRQSRNNGSSGERQPRGDGRFRQRIQRDIDGSQEWLTVLNGIYSLRFRAVMGVVPEQLQSPPVADSVYAFRRIQAQGEQLRHIILPDLCEPFLRLSSQFLDFHEVVVGASRPAAGCAHDLSPSHGLEVLQLGQDFVPPYLVGNPAAPPRSLLVNDAEPPHDHLVIVRRRVVARACARLLAIRRKRPRFGPLLGSSSHGKLQAAVVFG